MAKWPDSARGALSLSFDNLGEAAEIELGAFPADAPLGEHFTVTRVLRSVLTELMLRNLRATFFVEGLNAELYPVELFSAHLQNHELAYHAWRHEQWGDLSAAEQADNLARGIAAFRNLGGGTGVELTGLRPPGGQLGAGGLDVPREAGLRYCSPAGEGAGIEDGIALLPFQWQHVDATCVLPPLAPVRERMTGSPDPIDPDAFLAHLEAEIDRLSREGGFATIVLHLFMLDWLGEDRLGELFDRIVEARRSGVLWIARCGDIAEHVLSHPEAFQDGATLDPASWSD
ncbi:MAG TPA: polysaccharide deacetylase family protein [Solirubrobacterales bacterium]|nr:polysaccharide deacetylase family protein [Solirubrobacterales bacterium]